MTIAQTGIRDGTIVFCTVRGGLYSTLRRSLLRILTVWLGIILLYAFLLRVHPTHRMMNQEL